MSSRVLKIKDGKFVGVQSFEDRLKLCAVDSQHNGHTVCIQKHSSHNWIAFKFSLKDGPYFLKGDKHSLELVQLDHLDSDSVDYWFEKYDHGGSEHYGLRTVHEPQKYVCTTKNGRRTLFSLSDTKWGLAEVKDEAK